MKPAPPVTRIIGGTLLVFRERHFTRRRRIRMAAMPAQRVLFVKLSSLGDVVHNMPAVTDLARHRPGTHIAWAVEEAYVPLVKLHPAVVEAFPVGLRSLRRWPLGP